MKNSCAFTRGPALSCEWALQQWLSQSYYELQYAVMQFGDMKNKRGIFFFSILFSLFFKTLQQTALIARAVMHTTPI